MKFELIAKNEERIAGFRRLPELEKPYLEGYLDVGERSVPVAATTLRLRDILGGLLVRWNFGRMRYRILPGLYAVGNPGPESPVFASANYKLSFDSLRRELPGIDAWILVLDTKGINVWCAAGKGSFGTKELVARIGSSRLADMVSGRSVILPQLGAPGVSAQEVARRTGFKVAYGPVRARDIPAFLAAGMEKTADMRTVRFGLKDRLAVAPVEAVQAWPVAAASFAMALAAALVPGSAMEGRFPELLLALLGIPAAGAFAFPALLPRLPFRAFSLKGATLGLAYGILVPIALAWGFPLALAFALVSTAVVSFMGMNFTGATTYTSPSGAAMEVARSVVPQGIALVSGLALGVAAMVRG